MMVKSQSAALACAVGVALVMTLGGCGRGPSPDEQLWQAAARILAEADGYGNLMATDPQRARSIYAMAAERLESVLENHPDASEGLRAALQQMRDDYQQLGSGNLSGGEASEVRDRQQEYLSYFREQQLPPAYR